MSDRNAGVTADPVFLGVTRPPMRFGVTYMALVFNAVFTMEVFILVKNPLTLLIALPIHGICMLLCARDPRYFDLALLWGKTRLVAHLCSIRYWKGASYSPLTHDLPTAAGRRKASPTVRADASPTWHPPRFPSPEGKGFFLSKRSAQSP